MLGGGSEGAWQLPGLTSVVPGGQSCPGVIWVPPRMPCAAIAPLRAPLARRATMIRDLFMDDCCV